MNVSNFVFMLAVLSAVSAIPVNREERCERVDKELQLFRGILVNSSNLNITIDNMLKYFNVSDLYTPLIVDKIEELCSKKIKEKNN